MPKHFKNNVLNFWGNIKVINIFLSAKKRLAPHVFMALRYSSEKRAYYSPLFSTLPFSTFNHILHQNIYNSKLSVHRRDTLDLSSLTHQASPASICIAALSQAN